MPHKFWIAWSNHGITGTRQTTHMKAAQEANDLARQHPGIKFYVLEALDYRMAEWSPITTIKL